MQNKEEPKEESHSTLKELKERLAAEQKEIKENREKNQIKTELAHIDRQKKHPRLASFAHAIKSFFRKFGRGMKKTGSSMGKLAHNLNEADKRLAEAKAKQAAQKPQQVYVPYITPRKPILEESEKKPKSKKSISEVASDAANIVPTI